MALSQSPKRIKLNKTGNKSLTYEVHHYPNGAIARAYGFDKKGALRIALAYHPHDKKLDNPGDLTRPPYRDITDNPGDLIRPHGDIIKSVKRYRDGQLHRKNGAALRRYRIDHCMGGNQADDINVLVRSECYRKGVLHSEHGPAVKCEAYIAELDTVKTMRAEWWKDGVHTRTVKYNWLGMKCADIFWDVEPHKKIRYDENEDEDGNKVKWLEYWQDGRWKMAPKDLWDTDPHWIRYSKDEDDDDDDNDKDGQWKSF